MQRAGRKEHSGWKFEVRRCMMRLSMCNHMPLGWGWEGAKRKVGQRKDLKGKGNHTHWKKRSKNHSLLGT